MYRNMLAHSVWQPKLNQRNGPRHRHGPVRTAAPQLPDRVLRPNCCTSQSENIRSPILKYFAPSALLLFHVRLRK